LFIDKFVNTCSGVALQMHIGVMLRDDICLICDCGFHTI